MCLAACWRGSDDPSAMQCITTIHSVHLHTDTFPKTHLHSVKVFFLWTCIRKGPVLQCPIECERELTILWVAGYCLTEWSYLIFCYCNERQGGCQPLYWGMPLSEYHRISKRRAAIKVYQSQCENKQWIRMNSLINGSTTCHVVHTFVNSICIPSFIHPWVLQTNIWADVYLWVVGCVWCHHVFVLLSWSPAGVR